MNTERKVCVRCCREGHRSHACKLPILQPQKSENPDQLQPNGVSNQPMKGENRHV